MREIVIGSLLAAIAAHLMGWAAAIGTRHGAQAKKTKDWSFLVSGFAALMAAFSLAAFLLSGPVSAVFPKGPLPHQASLGLGIFVNGLSSSFALTISILAFLVFAFSRRYLRGDASERSFYAWGHLTVAFVLIMTFADNLGLFGLCWLASSLSLHKLLTLYAGRPAARFAAHKKFVVSRIGDLCLISAGVLLYGSFGTLNFAALSSLARALPSGATSEVQAIAALLVVGAMTKSAQVPFHSWLPESLEAPTPVSALMHAGVINAGGYLILRTYDFVHSARWAVELLCIVGILSVILCGLTKLTIPDLKRRLAYSTSAQMGFMFLQLGLGVPGAAFLHMLGHAFFKAHAFLTSGWLPVQHHGREPSLRGTLIGVGGVSLLGLAPVILHLAGMGSFSSLSTAVATSFLCLAGCEGLRRVFLHAGPRAFPSAAIVVIIACGGVVATVFGRLLARFIGVAAAAPGYLAASDATALLALCAFLGLLWFQALLPSLRGKSFVRALYVLSRNGFYFESITRRVLRS